MRQELLKILTSDDIQEILDAGELLRQNNQEPTARDMLRHLLEKNKCPPSIGERFPFILACAEIAAGRRLSRERSKENTTLRAMVSHRLRLEGYTYSEIGKMIQRDHSTVMHLCGVMRDMLSVPNAYREEMEIWGEFERLAGQPLQRSQPSSQTTSASAIMESPAR